MKKSELEYELALFHAPYITSSIFLKVKKHFQSIADIFTAPPYTLTALGFTEAQQKYLQKPNWAAVWESLTWAEQPHHTILRYADEHYPPLLREIPNPPPVLFAQGDIKDLLQPQIAIVGSRNPTAGGKETAYQFAAQLSRDGFLITSGLAIGIDGAAHEGALSVRAHTVAVLGTGLKHIYPRIHENLAMRIAENGVLLSEFPLNESARAENFPRRNRLISGLSLGILVVEAAPSSGSLITAKHALEQNREVFALPGSIHNPLSRGCHDLLKQGAHLVENCGDIFRELRGFLSTQNISKNPQPSFPVSTIPLDPAHKKCLHAVDFAATPIDAIIDRSGLTAEKVSSMLSRLELEGLISVAPGGYIRQPLTSVVKDG